MLFDHDGVDDLRVSEGEEAEAARTTGGAVSHDGALDDIAELREILLERFYTLSVALYVVMIWLQCASRRPYHLLSPNSTRR